MALRSEDMTLSIFLDCLKSSGWEQKLNCEPLYFTKDGWAVDIIPDVEKACVFHPDHGPLDTGLGEYVSYFEAWKRTVLVSIDPSQTFSDLQRRADWLANR